VIVVVDVIVAVAVPSGLSVVIVIVVVGTPGLLMSGSSSKAMVAVSRAVAVLPVGYSGDWISTIFVITPTLMVTRIAIAICAISFLTFSTIIRTGAGLDICKVKRIMVRQGAIAIDRGWCCADRERLQEEYRKQSKVLETRHDGNETAVEKMEQERTEREIKPAAVAQARLCSWTARWSPRLKPSVVKNFSKGLEPRRRIL
jgi:hypothetical protein